MKHKRVVWTITMVLVLLLLGTAFVYAQSDQAKLVVINYVGTELGFTLDGTAYLVPGTDVAPEGGQMVFPLSPGVHEYSGVVPGGPGMNGQLELAAGQVYVMGARVEQTPAVISPDGVVLQKPKDRLVLFEASDVPGVPTAPATMVPLRPIPVGLGALVMDNYIGEELVVDVDGAVYKVPANSRLQIDLNPGEVSYTASVSTSSQSADVEVVAGEYTGLGFSRDYEVPAEYEEGQPAPTAVPLKIHINSVDLSGAEIAEPQATEQAPLVEETDAEVGDTAPIGGVTGITVINYTGRELTFTLADEQHVIREGVLDTVIELDQGEYGYTASVPSADYNGSLVVSKGQMVRLSVSMSDDDKVVRVYFE